MPLDKSGLTLDLTRMFGKDRAQEDVNLQSYFIRTPQYDEIATGDKELVLGRKGSGKSALFLILLQELAKSGFSPIGISPKGEDFAVIHTKLKDYSDIDLSDDFKYALVWKDFILTEIALTIVKKVNSGSNPLRKYLRHEGRIEKSFVDKFFGSIIKVFGRGKIDLDIIELDFDFTALTPEAFNKDEMLKYLHEKIAIDKYFVLFDNLDEPWVNNPQMNSWLRGLILCIRQLKRDFNNLKMVVFLRDDIFDEISKGSDLFDSRSEVLSLNWRDKNYVSLRQLIGTRIAAYFGRAHPKSVSEIISAWNVVYDQNVSYRTRYGNKDVETYKYIIDRTFFRPRELIQYCRLAIEKSRNRYLPVEKQMPILVEPEYCDWKIRDLVGEYSKTFVNIDRCIYTFAGISVNWRLEYKQLVSHIKELPPDAAISNKIDQRILDPDEAIQLLFRVGFLRRMKKLSFGVIFLTFIDESNLNPRVSTFDVHPAFRKKLIRV
jgi:hypothetical protein